MLANNGKISVHQISRLLFISLTARLMLFLPYVGTGMSGAEFLAAVALGIFWAFLYTGLIAGIAEYTGNSEDTGTTVHNENPVSAPGSFTAYLQERVGRYTAYAFCILMILFLILHLAYLARLTGAICRLYLLPETSENTLLVCTLLAGAVTAAGGRCRMAGSHMEKQEIKPQGRSADDGQICGRMAEIFFLPVAAALIIMLLASAGSVRLENLSGNGSFPDAGNFDVMKILGRSGAFAGSFFEVTLILYELPYISRRESRSVRTLRGAMQKGILLTAGFLLAVFGIALGVFGESSFSRLSWPALTLMSSASVPGGFLQRWDAVFLAVLLPGLFLAAGNAFHYLRRIAGELLPENKSVWLTAGTFAAGTLPALLTGNYENAVRLYFRWGLCTLVPLLAAAPVFLNILERMKKKCGL